MFSWFSELIICLSCLVRKCEAQIISSLNKNHNKKSRIYGTSDSFAKINLICQICQICQRVRSVRPICEAVWSVWESEVRGHEDRTASPGRSNAFSREISQASPRIVLPRPVCVRGRSASHAQRAMQSDPRLNALLRPLCVRGRSDSHGLTDLRGRVRERPIGLPRPHRSERPCAWEAVLPWLAQTDHMTNCVRPRGWEAEFGLSRPLTASHGLSRPPMHSLTASHGLSQPRTLSLSQSNDWKQGQRVHGRPWEAVRGRERPNSASHPLGLHKFHWKSNFRQQ